MMRTLWASFWNRVPDSDENRLPEVHQSSYVSELKHRLGAAPSQETIFGFALPEAPEQPQFRMMQNAPLEVSPLRTQYAFQF